MKLRFRPGLVAISASLLLASCGVGGGKPVEVTTNAAGFKQVQQIGMTFQWKVMGETLEIIVESPEKGWVGVGFDPEQFMKGANFIIGYVDSTSAKIEDHFGNQLTNHAEDVSLGGRNDVTIIEGRETASGTMLRFTIPLDSGDRFDKPLSPGRKHKVVLAYGTKDDFASEHAKDARATFEVEL